MFVEADVEEAAADYDVCWSFSSMRVVSFQILHVLSLLPVIIVSPE